MPDRIIDYARAQETGDSIDWNRAILIGGVVHALFNLVAWVLMVTGPSHFVSSWSWSITQLTPTFAELVLCILGARAVVGLRKTRWLLGACVAFDVGICLWLTSHILMTSSRSLLDPRGFATSALAYFRNSHWPIAMVVVLQSSKPALPQRAVKRLLIVAALLVSVMLALDVMNTDSWSERMRYAMVSFSGVAREVQGTAATVALIAIILALMMRFTVARAAVVSVTAFATVAAAALADQAHATGVTDVRNMGLTVLWIPLQAWVVYVLAFPFVFRIPVAKPV